MVQITTSHRRSYPSAGYEAAGTGQGTPQIHVHHVARDVFGNGIAIRSYGEIKIAAGEFVWAYELKMNTLQVLVLTPELNLNDVHGYMAQKAIWHKGECLVILKAYIEQLRKKNICAYRITFVYSTEVSHDNYASIDIYNDAATWQSPGNGPVLIIVIFRYGGKIDGSIWLKSMKQAFKIAPILLSENSLAYQLSYVSLAENN